MIRNFTPHPINILDTENKEIVTIAPEGISIRLKSTVKKQGSHNGLPLTKTVFGEPQGLPEVETETLLIVSQLVKSALPNRPDLVVPAELVRDDNGQIIGCRSLGV